MAACTAFLPFPGATRAQLVVHVNSRFAQLISALFPSLRSVYLTVYRASWQVLCALAARSALSPSGSTTAAWLKAGGPVRAAQDACNEACQRAVCTNLHQVPAWNDACLKRCTTECLRGRAS